MICTAAASHYKRQKLTQRVHYHASVHGCTLSTEGYGKRTNTTITDLGHDMLRFIGDHLCPNEIASLGSTSKQLKHTFLDTPTLCNTLETQLHCSIPMAKCDVSNSEVSGRSASRYTKSYLQYSLQNSFARLIGKQADIQKHIILRLAEIARRHGAGSILVSGSTAVMTYTNKIYNNVDLDIYLCHEAYKEVLSLLSENVIGHVFSKVGVNYSSDDDGNEQTQNPYNAMYGSSNIWAGKGIQPVVLKM